MPLDWLFALAIWMGGYSSFCNEHPSACVQPIVIPVPKTLMPDAVGMFLSKFSYAVFVRDDVNKVNYLRDSVLMHEFTHYLQYQQHGFIKYFGETDACLTMRLEIPAHYVDQRFTKMYNIKPTLHHISIPYRYARDCWASLPRELK